ncbi:MAG: chromate transporter, partial [Eubacteriales bacterium]|nr:chromate transporter [Eubacteriales bacterium]
MTHLTPEDRLKPRFLLQLFLVFFRIGLFTFGGGYAMIPLIERTIIERKRWLAQDELLDILTIAQTMPGPIAVNAA